MANDAQLNVRIWKSLAGEADRIAKEMSDLPAFELLGVSRRAVLRVALAKGVEFLESVDPKFFKLEHAKDLRKQLEAGIAVNFKGLEVRLPVINSLDVRLTPDSYIDLMFTGAIEEIFTGKQAGNRETLVNLRLPAEWLERANAVIARSIPSARSEMLRLAIKVGLFRLDHDVHWAKKRVEEETKGWRDGKIPRTTDLFPPETGQHQVAPPATAEGLEEESAAPLGEVIT